jgi:hypothetical protein
MARTTTPSAPEVKPSLRRAHSGASAQPLRKLEISGMTAPAACLAMPSDRAAAVEQTTASLDQMTTRAGKTG